MCLTWHPTASPFLSAYKSFPLDSLLQPSFRFILMTKILLSAICYLLSAVCCLLSVVCCLLSVVCCLLSAAAETKQNKNKTKPKNKKLLSVVCCMLSAETKLKLLSTEPKPN
jgi:hypothetical protein